MAGRRQEKANSQNNRLLLHDEIDLLQAAAIRATARVNSDTIRQATGMYLCKKGEQRQRLDVFFVALYSKIAVLFSISILGVCVGKEACTV